MTSEKLSTNQITKLLHDEINQMQHADNQKFATEREIMERFSVSRMSARQILNDLVAEGVLYREKGKGVFINKRIIQRSQYIYSFTEQMEERGLTPSSEVLDLKKILPPEIARLTLGMEEGEFCFFVKRLRFADNEPFAVETIYTPVSLVPNLDTYDLEHESFYRILEEDYHKEFSYNKEVVSAIEVEGEIAQQLYGKEHGIALKVMDILYDVNQQAMEYAESWYHAEKYSYVSISVKR
ncbi:GntR family transcriptional regulator [Candidatus Enterococcus ferrettii]|uniref:GntR family transcriptional regulator n=1 Tax=Candidatus Enterococcus ferrettii TaxID=2815324 RepID=A0ABV0EXD7_9ENTE|nr:GntR family transcriptional regulator [Enterococcus sp. 665A]MBO1339451.1 GntR family transcriptional regulator [Enterococcus sp. 665A]